MMYYKEQKTKKMIKKIELSITKKDPLLKTNVELNRNNNKKIVFFFLCVIL